MPNREDTIIEIVKRIETPQRESRDKEEVREIEKSIYIDESIYEEYEDKEKKPSKKVLPILFGITSIGIMGYLGVKYLNQDNKTNQAQTQTEIQPPIQNNIINNQTENKKSEKITTYTEELAKKEPSVTEKNVIATLLAYEKEIKKEEVPKEIILKQEIKKEEEPKEIIVKQEIEKEVIPKKEVQKEIIEPTTIQVIESIPKEIKIEDNEIIKKKKTIEIKYEPIKPRIIRVKKGESLASLAKRFYGNDMDFKRIIRANRRIKSSKTSLHFGEKIIIPRKDNKTSRRYVIVKKGYSLAYIAKKIYGSRDKISKIVRANYKIKNRYSKLQVGQKVYVPR